MDMYTECLVKAVPKKEIKSQHRRKKPPRWKEDIASARSALNATKRTYKRRRTPNNFECLKEKECELEKVSVLAKESWTELFCDNISCAKSAKAMWESFRVPTSYQDNGKGGVLPLLMRIIVQFSEETTSALFYRIFSLMGNTRNHVTLMRISHPMWKKKLGTYMQTF